MSIQDLKERLRDVPGIENLTMRLEGGQQVFSVGGAFATVHPSATIEVVDAAIRSVALPMAATVNAAPVATVNAVPASSSLIPAVTMAPAVIEGVKPMSSGTGASPVAGANAVKDLMSEHIRLMGEIQAAQVELLRSTLAQQRNSVSTAVGSVASKIAAQTDDFNAIMGQFTNDLG